MSIVAVHGPNTFGSKSIQETGPVTAVADPANGLKWDMRLDASTTRPDQDFSWAFPPDGTPTPQVKADPAVVTYAAAGTKTATCTVTNVSRTVNNKALTNNVATLTTSATHGFKVGQSVVISGVDATFNGTYVIASTPTGTTFTYALTAANVTSAVATGTAASDPAQYPPAGAYPVVVTAAAGVGPRSADTEVSQSSVDEPEDDDFAGAGFDPAAHTVAEVEEYVEQHPEEVEHIRQLEEDGKARVTLLTHLESLTSGD